jgi:hypothetical protein
MKARDIGPGTVRNFLNMLEEQGYSPAYVNSHRTMLNSIFN